jgi:tetratricopeptide (TPR) repeat protein
MIARCGAWVGLIALALLLPHGRASAQDPADRAWDRGDTRTAWTLYSRRLAADSTDMVALERLGLMAGWAGRYDQSLQLFDRLLRIAPDNVEAAVDRARVEAWQGHVAEAIHEVDAVLARAPGNVTALEARAQFLAWAGRLDSAAVVYQRLLAEDSTVTAMAGLARVRGWQGHVKEAERLWRGALARDSAYAPALTGLAETLRWEGRDAAAREVAERGTRLAPRDHDLQTQRTLVEVAMRPHTAFNFTYESDSDGNGVGTLDARGAWRPAPRLELRGSGYLRWLSLSGATAFSQQAYGGLLEGWTQLEPGWTFAAGLGASGSDVTGASAVTRYALRASSPRREPVVGTIALTHDPLDVTAPLVQHRVTVRQVALDVRAAPPGGWTITGAFSFARFEGSEPNDRTAGTAVVLRSFAHDFAVGGSARIYGFQKDLNDGYFDPSLYVLLEIPGRWQRAFGQVVPAVEVAPGLQKVESGSFSAAIRLQGELRYAVAAGREVVLRAGYSTLGMTLFASDVGHYRYRFVTLGGAWRF